MRVTASFASRVPAGRTGNFFDLVSCVTTMFRRVTEIGRKAHLALAERPPRAQPTDGQKTVVNRTCDGCHVVSAIWGSMVVIRLRRNIRSFGLAGNGFENFLHSLDSRGALVRTFTATVNSPS
jgi:hypothetical protein